MAMKKIKMVGSKALSISKEAGVCGLLRSASNPDLNRPTFKMEKWKGAVKMRDLGIRFREDDAYDSS